MQKETLQVALAGLAEHPGPLSGWGEGINEQSGGLHSQFSDVIAVAAGLSAGISPPVRNSDRLESIFNSITLDTKRAEIAKRQSYRPSALFLKEDVIFPEEQQGGIDQKASLDEIVKDIKQSLPDKYREDESYLEEVLSVLHRTTVNIPSSFSADVSHFDQQRMTAALAVCLMDKKQEEVQEYLTSFDKYKAEPVALLVGGDISGIQNFIYTISSKGAARTLRGRSFYLQLLTEAILRFVLQKLELPYTHVIYSGGGHFFLLAPLSTREKLEDAQRQISSILLKYHNTSLYFALGFSEIPVMGFATGEFPSYWGEMHGALARKKQQRYVELGGTELYDRLFKVWEFGGNPDDKCDVCGEDRRKTRKWDDGRDVQDKICSLCYSFFEDIGRQLPRNNFVALKFGSSQPVKKGTAMEVLAEFGMTFEFVESTAKLVQKDADRVVLWAFDDFKESRVPTMVGVPVWLRYTANQVTSLEFNDLLKKVQGGFERLGVLRMDVDGLGEIFKRGLGRNATLTRLATLSFRISLFFEGWLKKLCEENGRKDLIYTVYTGGDDVFLLGPWDIMPELARDIVNGFAKYCSGNPDMHLSAGLAFIGGKYPVYQAADDAKDAIDQAKLLAGKNAFTFLGNTWQWIVFEDIASKREVLDKLVAAKEDGGKDGPQALLHLLQQLAVDERQFEKSKGRHVWGRWIWTGMYQLTRMQERYREFAVDIKFIRDKLADTQYQEIGQWGTAARWLELRSRKKTQKEDV